MPCSDYTELLKVVIGHDDSLLRFGLKKQSCGQTIGGALLHPFVQGKSSSELLRSRIRELVPDFDVRDGQEQFLLLKQFYSIRAALQVFLGETSGSKDEAFVLEKVDYDAEGAAIYGIVRVEMVAKDMEACEGCGCSIKK